MTSIDDINWVPIAPSSTVTRLGGLPPDLNLYPHEANTLVPFLYVGQLLYKNKCFSLYQNPQGNFVVHEEGQGWEEDVVLRFSDVFPTIVAEAYSPARMIDQRCLLSVSLENFLSREDNEVLFQLPRWSSLNLVNISPYEDIVVYQNTSGEIFISATYTTFSSRLVQADPLDISSRIGGKPIGFYIDVPLSATGKPVHFLGILIINSTDIVNLFFDEEASFEVICHNISSNYWSHDLEVVSLETKAAPVFSEEAYQQINPPKQPYSPVDYFNILLNSETEIFLAQFGDPTDEIFPHLDFYFYWDGSKKVSGFVIADV